MLDQWSGASIATIKSDMDGCFGKCTKHTHIAILCLSEVAASCLWCARGVAFP
jgi:hypothetical protein